MTYRAKIPEAYARVQWCKETFGPPFQYLPTCDRTWDKMRWWCKGDYLYFRREKDYVLYLLRWA